MSEVTQSYRAGYVAIVGRPNVGKSTLLNHLIRQKISITSRRPQTTRHVLLGVQTLPFAQIVYVDTPGIHASEKKAMNRYMNRSATTILNDVDVVLFVIEGLHWSSEDDFVLQKIASIQVPVLLIVNKIDLIKEKKQLLPWLEEIGGKGHFDKIIPVSALRGSQLEVLETEIVSLLPAGERIFPDDQLTDRPMKFLVAEIVREKLTRSLGQELPYALTVEIERYEESGGLVKIGAVIWVERKGQKAIVIGKGGSVLKKIGQSARKDIENLVGTKVYLQLWVKVREGWSDDERALRSLGYGDY